MFKSIGFAAAATCVLLTGASAATPPALAPFTQFVDAMNAGDAKTAAGTYAPTAVIIDEFAPHIWMSFASWNADAGAEFKKNAVTDFHIALSPASFKNMDATTGYGVAPATLTYKVKGKPIVEKGLFTVSTAKGAGGWHITGWAWSTL
ncbi:MAG TPA: hypothetical protein VGG48_07855 [Rhizomicrobium sp.]|jgi:hypothetical protein